MKYFNKRASDSDTLWLCSDMRSWYQTFTFSVINVQLLSSHLEIAFIIMYQINMYSVRFLSKTNYGIRSQKSSDRKFFSSKCYDNCQVSGLHLQQKYLCWNSPKSQHTFSCLSEHDPIFNRLKSIFICDVSRKTQCLSMLEGLNDIQSFYRECHWNDSNDSCQSFANKIAKISGSANPDPALQPKTGNQSVPGYLPNIH